MQIYTVTGSPVLVRQIPSADAKVMNVLPTGSKLYIIADEEGWLRTSSGYYVFHTDDVTIDTNPAPTLSAIKNVPMRLRAGAQLRGVEIDPELLETDTTDIPSGGSLRDVKGDTPAPDAPASGDDSTDISVDHAVELTDKYKGKTIKANGKGTCLVYNDADGTWTETEIPAAMLEKQNGTFIEAIDPSGNVTVIAPDGKHYMIDGAQVSVADAKSDGSVGDYTQFEVDQLQQENKDADDLIAGIMETLSESLRAVINASELKIEDIRTVFGMPYQFLATADPRPDTNHALDDKKFGRKYMEKIVTRAPILVMQPGEAVFLRGYSDDVKERVMSEVLGVVAGIVGGDDTKSELDKMLNGGGEYYSFRVKHTDYFSCINGALRAVAILMGLENVTVDGLSVTSNTESGIGEVFKDLEQNQLGSFNWLLNTEHPLGGYYVGAVQFYINSEAQIQESFSTGTRPSSLASRINQITDQAAEAMFVMGGIRADIKQTTGHDILGSDEIGNSADDMANLLGTSGTSGAGSGASTSGLLHSIIGNISTLLAGGKMYFPEIWSDSQFSRSYNVTIKLDSPDADPLSVYLNIMVPLIHILGFVLPRSAGDNTYISPFLVRCFYKSMFHVDMGIINSCSITKGDQGAWTQNGLPTQVTVQLSIKDLYSVMTQSRGVGANTLLSNPAQLDYLANLCGINIAPSNFGRTFKLWWTIKGPQKAIDYIVNSGVKLITSAYTTFYNFASPGRWQM